MRPASGFGFRIDGLVIEDQLRIALLLQLQAFIQIPQQHNRHQQFMFQVTADQFKLCQDFQEFCRRTT